MSFTFHSLATPRPRPPRRLRPGSLARAIAISFFLLFAISSQAMTISDDPYVQVQQLLDAGKIKEATTLLNRLTKADPADWHAPNLLGNLALAQGDAKSAEQYYLEAINRDPSQAELHNNLAVLYLKGGQGQKALQELLLAVRLEPENSQALFNLATIYQANNTNDKALDYLQRAANSDPANTRIQFELIGSLLAAGKLRESAVQCQIVVDHYPQSAEVRTDLGFLLLHYNLIDDAAGQFGRAANLDPKLARAWYGLGLTARRLGQADVAIQTFEKAVALESSQPDYLSDLGYTLLTRKTPEATAAAERYLQQAVKAAPKHARSNYLLGLFYTEQGNSSKAVGYFATAHIGGLRSPGFLLHYARALLDTGKTKEGRGVAQEALTIPSLSPEQKHAAEQLLR